MMQSSCSVDGKLIFNQPAMTKIEPKMLAAQTIPVPPAGWLNSRISDTEITYGVPARRELVKSVAIPAIDRLKVQDILTFEAAQQIPYRLRDVYYGFALAGERGSFEWGSLIFSIKANDLEPSLRSLHENEMMPTNIRSDSAALINTVIYQQQGNADPVMVIFDLHDCTFIVLKTGKHIFCRTIKLGLRQIPEGVDPDTYHSISMAEKGHQRNTAIRLHSELIRTINFYRSQRGGASPRHCYFSADEMFDYPSYTRFFSEKLNIPCEQFDIGKLFKSDSPKNTQRLLEYPASTAVAIGHALAEHLTSPIDFNYLDSASPMNSPLWILSR